MRLQNKLIIVFLFLATIPLLTSGFFLLDTLNQQLAVHKDEMRELQIRTLARRLDRNLIAIAEALRDEFEVLSPWNLNPAERVGFLRLIYSQRGFLNAIQLLGEDGEETSSPATYISDPALLVGNLAGHAPIREEELVAARKPALLKQARKTGTAWGDPIYLDGDRPPHLPLAITLTHRGQTGIAFALISLTSALGEDLTEETCLDTPEGGCATYLLDKDLAIAHGTGPESIQSKIDFSDELLDVLMDNTLTTGVMSGDIGSEYVALDWQLLSTAPLTVLIRQPDKAVYQAREKAFNAVIYWFAVSLIIALVFGLYFGRTIATPVRELADGVLEIARGNFDASVDVRTNDEIGRLASTFNIMAGALKNQKAEIERQGEEIRNWNLKLQARVEERTRELNEAQGYLIHTQKLAAVAELGSGVAHELNNPLSAVLGFTQILIAQKGKVDEKGEEIVTQELKHLRLIEKQTLRCREIVQHLLRFSQEQIDRGAFDSVDLHDVVGTVIKLFEGNFASRNVNVNNMLEPKKYTTWGNRAQLLQAFLQLFSAIRTVLSVGQPLEISGEVTSEGIQLGMTGPLRALSGESGEPFQAHVDRDQAMAQGLGLWLARKIFQEHQGTLEIEVPEEAASEDKEFARLLVLLPLRNKARNRGHG